MRPNKRGPVRRAKGGDGGILMIDYLVYSSFQIRFGNYWVSVALVAHREN